jgi:hypothetical protein
MTIERIKELYEATLFQPFILHLADGREIPVLHREFVAAAPSGRTLVVFQPEDRMNIIDLLLVTDVELNPSSNGSSRRRRKRG